MTGSIALSPCDCWATCLESRSVCVTITVIFCWVFSVGCVFLSLPVQSIAWKHSDPLMRHRTHSLCPGLWNPVLGRGLDNIGLALLASLPARSRSAWQTAAVCLSDWGGETECVWLASELRYCTRPEARRGPLGGYLTVGLNGQWPIRSAGVMPFIWLHSLPG